MGGSGDLGLPVLAQAMLTNQSNYLMRKKIHTKKYLPSHTLLEKKTMACYHLLPRE